MSEKIKSKNLHKKIFLIKITYINNRFNETGFCGEWIDRISQTEINTQNKNDDNEKTKFIYKKTDKKYIYLSFIQGQNLEDDFVDYEELDDIYITDDIRAKRLFIILYDKTTDEILCNWTKSGTYSHKKYKELMFGFFGIKDPSNTIKLEPYFDVDFVNKITQLNKLTIGYTTRDQEEKLFKDNNDLPLQNITEMYGSQKLEIKLSENIKWHERQKKDLKKKLTDRSMKIHAIGHDDSGMRYAFDNTKITKNVSIIIDYANIDHENIIDQLLKIGGDNEK